MKSKGIVLLSITTILLVMLIIMAAFDFKYAWIFSLTTIGQILLVVSVYHVLRDDYKTEKTFKDWYEDKPVKTETD
jgi:hypothetical protein